MKQIILLFSLFLSNITFAGCFQYENQYMFYLKNNKIVHQGKGTVDQCSNMYEGHSALLYRDYVAKNAGIVEGNPIPKGFIPVTVNDKKAILIKKRINGKKLDCFVFGKHKNEMLCGDLDPPLQF